MNTELQRSRRCRPSLSRPRLGARRGFTLIELLAVIVILSILAYFLINNVTAAKTSVEEKATRAYLAQIAAVISEYADEHGDAPPSSFPAEWGPQTDPLNLGGEALYLALCAEGAPGGGRLDEEPVNTDGDQAAQRVPGHQSLELFELADNWGNPIAYYNHRDYERKDAYLCFEDAAGEELESTALPRKNVKTGRWLAPRGFQLLSAGPNGRFDEPGSDEDDDIAHAGGG
jgi:prepilin-type N-terminal cleavage/methylation domain-containing protein